MGQRDQFQEQPRVLMAGSTHSRVDIFSGWRTGESTLSVMYSCESGAVISGNLVYFNSSKSKEIYAHDHTLTTNCWS